MPEDEDAGTDIARIEPTELQRVSEMDLDTARTIIQAVVDTPESTITQDTPLDQIAGYSTNQVRTASKVVLESVMKEQGESPGPKSGMLVTSKKTPEGRLQLTFTGSFLILNLYCDSEIGPKSLSSSNDPDVASGESRSLDKNISLPVGRQGRQTRTVSSGATPDSIAYMFALEEQKDDVARMVTSFHDSRPEAKIHESLYDIQKSPTMGSFRRMIRGLRWMSANMLNWDNPNTIMPEQLDNKSLSPDPPNALPAAEE